jgi:hypothetical protein
MLNGTVGLPDTDSGTIGDVRFSNCSGAFAAHPEDWGLSMCYMPFRVQGYLVVNMSGTYENWVIDRSGDLYPDYLGSD